MTAKRLTSDAATRWRRMLAAARKKNRHAKGDDTSKAYSPPEFHNRQPVWLRVKLVAEYPAMLFGKPLSIATTMKPMIIAIMFP